MMMLCGLSACGTREILRTVDTACMSFRAISYAIPPVQADGTRNVAVDDGNRLDTPETVDEIAQHNARFNALCSAGK